MSSKSGPTATLVAAIAIAAVTVAAGCGTGRTSAQRIAEREASVAANQTASWQRYGDYAAVDLTADATEADVLAEMIAHHVDAIDGSNAFLAAAAGTGAVGAFAARIARVQTSQVDTMQGWLREWHDATPAARWQAMFADPATTTDPAAYLATMIDHHHHAVLMYRTWANAEVIEHHAVGRLLRTIAKAQEGEMATMCQLLGTLPDAAPSDASWCVESTT